MITIMGTVGRCCVVPDDIGHALSSKHVWTLTFDQSRYSPFLACMQINYAPWVMSHFRQDEQGGIMSAVRSETLRTTLFPVPPPDEQDRIEAILRGLSVRLANECCASEKLRTFKCGLRDELLTGRTRVPASAGVSA
jgi:type I restriction enzyme S subunit